MKNKRQTKTTHIAARVSPGIKRAAVAMAEQDGQSLASFLETLVRDEAKRRGIPITRPDPPNE